MKLSFIHAPKIQYDQNYGTLFSPLWAYTLAAHVPAGWHQTITDCMTDDLHAVEEADVFAFSGINQDMQTIRAAYEVLKKRCPAATFILGGPITWSMEKEGKLDLLSYFDHLFILDGEQTLPAFLKDFERGIQSPKVIRAERFPMNQARSIRFDIYERCSSNYYGAVVEVSRGCPFLCEFCDIRVLPGNNRSNNKAPELIVAEIDAYHRLGVTQFQFACDNFIGDIAWARRCVDAILEWKERIGAKISIFTWLTINLYKLPDLMAKMRRAGFSILFIGIESVNQNSLLETAKVQNSKVLEPAVTTIQSYGFIIAPGFIFGFDSDTASIFDDTLDFLKRTGVIGGDPSFLTALPGTPLFQRMRSTKRLIEGGDAGTVRRKISTNIRYLQDADLWVRGFLRFIARYNSAEFQYERFASHVELVTSSNNFIGIDGVGYGSPVEYLALQWRTPENRKMLLRRILFLLHRPFNIVAILRARRLIRRYAAQGINLDTNFNYWVYVWTNIGLKYWDVRASDFDIKSVPADFDVRGLLGDTPSNGETSSWNQGDEKREQQSRYTSKALKSLISDRIRQKQSAST